jgi:hypothetical protein
MDRDLVPPCASHRERPFGATIATMRSLPTILLILSFPVGALAYVVAARILGELPVPAWLQGFLVLFAPLFVAGLVMIPFLIPFFDRKAKADLAGYRRMTESSGEAEGDGDSGDPKPGPYDGDA